MVVSWGFSLEPTTRTPSHATLAAVDTRGSFYGDVFRIAEWNVAIFGFGKSQASRVATQWDAARREPSRMTRQAPTWKCE
jgi:hypothetical protein